MSRSSKTVTFLLLICALASFANAQQAKRDPLVEARIDSLITRLTLDEKISLIAGTGFDTVPIKRLGIPSLNMTDGPAGVRIGPASSFPSGIALAATFNPQTTFDVGRAIAQEAKAKGFNVLLGPAVDIARVPFAGRSFEAYGEDPFLSSQMAVEYIRGIQSENVIATVKHFAANNQETDRKTIDALVDERTLNEIYFPPFRAAVQQAGVLSVMSSYNKLNGFYASENEDLLTAVLKKRWGFDGLVMSDWGAVHSTVPTINAGLDLEMPTNIFLNSQDVRKALANNEIKESRIDDMVRRLLRVMIAAHILGGSRDKGGIDTPAHRSVALSAARESIVLLKNEKQTLPIDVSLVRSIAVIGPNADVARIGGGGSAEVKPFYSVSPLEGLRSKVGKNVKVNFSPGVVSAADTKPIPSENLRSADGKSSGLTGDYFANMEFAGKPAFTRIDPQLDFHWATGSPAENFPADLFSNRWQGYIVAPVSGRYSLSLSSNDGGRLYLDGKMIVDVWGDHATLTGTAEVELKAGEPRPVMVEHYENIGNADLVLGWRLMEDNIADKAAETARNADVAVVFVGLSDAIEAESRDRTTLDLPAEQIELIKKVAAANPRTIVVNTSGAPILMNDWLDRVAALVQAFYYGQEGGNAIADVLLGSISPSGKLPVTFLKRWEDAPAYDRYPGDGTTVNYSEGIFVGYRWFDRKGIEPQFPFGYGLSFTTFEYSDLKFASKRNGELRVTFKIKNTGTRDGAEAAQVYVGDTRSSVERPPKELKGIAKVFLKAGEKKTVSVELKKDAFAFYDARRSEWKAERGGFDIMVGGSSRDIRLRGRFNLGRNIIFK